MVIRERLGRNRSSRGKALSGVSRKALVKKADKYISLTIRHKAKGVCFICGLRKEEKEMHLGHLFSRSSYSTRWCALNCFCSCPSCNYRHEFDFEPFRRRFVEEYGDELYDKLYAVYRSPVKFSNSELEEIGVFWKNEYERIIEAQNELQTTH